MLWSGSDIRLRRTKLGCCGTPVQICKDFKKPHGMVGLRSVSGLFGLDLKVHICEVGFGVPYFNTFLGPVT